VNLALIFPGRILDEASAMAKDSLRLLIREKLDDGRLPPDCDPRVWGGPGNGETCDGCGEIVTRAEMVVDVSAADGCDVQLHVACFQLWEAERGHWDALEYATSRHPW
jgi:hypothetical protein